MSKPKRLSAFVAITLAAGLSGCEPDSQAPALSASTPEATAPTASATPPAKKPASTSSHWRCGDMDAITRFDEASLDAMVLIVAGQELVLHSVESNEGARFTDAAGNAFSSSPGRVSLTVAGSGPTTCTKQKAAP
ncbi:hypothetical protein [Lysobacter fragariae]